MEPWVVQSRTRAADSLLACAFPGGPEGLARPQEATDKVGEGRDDMSSHQGRHLLTTIPLGVE